MSTTSERKTEAYSSSMHINKSTSQGSYVLLAREGKPSLLTTVRTNSPKPRPISSHPIPSPAAIFFSSYQAQGPAPSRISLADTPQPPSLHAYLPSFKSNKKQSEKIGRPVKDASEYGGCSSHQGSYPNRPGDHFAQDKTQKQALFL